MSPPARRRAGAGMGSFRKLLECHRFQLSLWRPARKRASQVNSAYRSLSGIFAEDAKYHKILFVRASISRTATLVSKSFVEHDITAGISSRLRATAPDDARYHARMTCSAHLARPGHEINIARNIYMGAVVLIESGWLDDKKLRIFAASLLTILPRH